jgi:hypothetical protein
MTVVAVDDADAHHARAVQAGADIIKEPIDQPYGVREYGARDHPAGTRRHPAPRSLHRPGTPRGQPEIICTKS